MVATTVKWAGMVEASPVRYAHLLAPGDWIVCAQSSLRDLSPPYAMFFTGDKLVHYRIAVEIDDCRRAPYAPATALAGQAGYTGQCWATCRAYGRAARHPAVTPVAITNHKTIREVPPWPTT